MAVVLLLLGGLFYLLYRWSTSTYDYWADRKVPYQKPVPFFGNVLSRMLSRESAAVVQQKRYDQLGEHKFGGGFTFRKPNLFIKDPALIEQILIKDFSTFYNRALNRDANLKPLSRNLLNLENAQWKILRNKLTPCFSSAKMKFLHQGLLDCCDHLVEHLSTYAETGEPLDVKKTMSRFAVYAIGTVAFGIQLDSLNDPDCQFAKMGETLFSTSLIGGVIGIVKMQFPKFGGYLEKIYKGFKNLAGKETSEDHNIFFMNVVKNSVEYREENNVRRNDFLQILMELKKQDAKSSDGLKFDLELMSANAFVFLLAGYDTTSNTISFMLHELAANMEVQEKLHDEIVEILKKHDGVTSYEAIKEMKYLDQALSETLRLYPPIPLTFRVSRNDYQISDTSFILPSGTIVNIPIFAVQRDPKYFPEPDKFDPERFSDEARIIKGTYLPFGDGPRICIGMRMAKLEVKMAIIKILMKYKITVNEKTQLPLQFEAKKFFLNAEGGLWINLSKRE